MRAAVLGKPITHSLSPVLHRAAYRELGLAWSYEAVECDEARLPGFLGGLDGTWAGLSLTMPLKRAVLPLLDEVSELAAGVGGANTVVFDGDRRIGHNTDVYGIVTALTEGGLGKRVPAVILGGGATACSALAALKELGLDMVTLLVRDVSRTAEASTVAGRLGVRVISRPLDDLPAVLDGTGLVISTLPAGAADGYAPLVADSGASVFDVVYAPRPSPLAAAVRSAGRTAVDGLPMLLHQAVRQVSLMTGYTDVPVVAMRVAAERALVEQSR